MEISHEEVSANITRLTVCWGIVFCQMVSQYQRYGSKNTGKNADEVGTTVTNAKQTPRQDENGWNCNTIQQLQTHKQTTKTTFLSIARLFTIKIY